MRFPRTELIGCGVERGNGGSTRVTTSTRPFYHGIQYNDPVRVALIAIVLLGGCVDDRLQSCAADLTCPIGSTCVDGMFCATRSALDACTGRDEAAPCNSASVSGYCVHGACRTSTCGNGVVEYGEACDDGNLDDSDDCTSACAVARCGDDIVSTSETCDDHPGEVTVCDYGTASCMVCDVTCHLVPATGNVCGDRVIATPDEVCDDGNTSACGTCDPTCRVRASAFATGSIVAVAGAALNAGETFTLNDGRHPAVIFEFTTTTAATGHVGVTFSAASTGAQVATAMAVAINAVVLLDINATSSGVVVTVTNAFKTSNGNQAIPETVGDPGFVGMPMTGGAGGNCAGGVGCATNEDCSSHNCLATHVCAP